MAQKSFEKYFLHLPQLVREENFYEFWKNSLIDQKRISLNPEFTQDNRKSGDRFSVYNVTYRGFLRTKITGELFIPVKSKKPRVIIHIHDYNNIKRFKQTYLDSTVAYFFITLRGHNDLIITDEQQSTPGFMIEHILDIETYYVKAVYLDVYRAADAMRLNPLLDCSSIGMMGKGLGAAAALFTSAFSKRVKALVLDTPSFCYLQMSQNLSTSDAANEINEYVSTVRSKKNQIKKNLSYFDMLNFTDRIKCPVLATVGLKDTISPPECIFALFNHLKCEKTIEVYPDDGHDAGGKLQFRKSIKWLIDLIAY